MKVDIVGHGEAGAAVAARLVDAGVQPLVTAAAAQRLLRTGAGDQPDAGGHRPTPDVASR